MNNKNLYLIFLVSLILRLGYMFVMAPQQHHQSAGDEKVLYAGDALGYHTIALNLYRGNGYSMVADVPTVRRAPGYPLFLAGIYSIFGTGLMAVYIIQALLSALTCVMTYLIAKNVYDNDRELILLPTWLMVLYPVFYAYSLLVLTEILFTFLLAVSVLFLLKQNNEKLFANNLMSGFFLGLSALVRPTVILLPVVIVVVYILFRYMEIKKINFLWDIKNILLCSIYIIAFAIVIFPWMFRNYKVSGRFSMASIGLGYGLYTSGRMAEEKGLNDTQALEEYSNIREDYFARNNRNSPVADFEFEEYMSRRGLEIIKKNFRSYVLLVVKRLPRFWITSHSSVFGVDKPISEYLSNKRYLPVVFRLSLLLIHFLFVFAALVGGILLLRSLVGVKSHLAVFYLVAIVIYFTGHIFFDPCPRYYLPVMPYVFILGAPLLSYKKMFFKVSKHSH